MKEPSGQTAKPEESREALRAEVDGLRRRCAALEQATAQAARTEATLRESEGRHRTIWDKVQTGVMIIDPVTHTIVEVNPAAATLIGASPKQLVGKTCFKYVCPADLGRCPITHLHQEVDNSERVLLRIDGTRRQIIKTVVPVMLDGRTHLLESFVDITGRKEAEEALRVSEQRYRNLLQNVPGVVFRCEVTPPYPVLFLAGDVETMSGYPATDFVNGGRTLDMLLVEALPAEFHRLVAEAVATRRPFEAEFRIRHADGSIRWMFDRGRAVYGSDGAPLWVDGLILDITARKQAEQASAERTRQLESIRALGEEITRELELQTLLELLTRRAVELVNAESGAVHTWDEAGQVVIPQAWHGKLSEWQTEIRYGLGEGVVGAVALRRQGLMVNDYPRSTYAHPIFAARTEIGAVLAEPLLYQTQLLGVIALTRAQGRPFTADDQRLVRLFATQAAVAIENARLYDAAQRELAERRQAEGALATRRQHLEAVRAVMEEITRELELGKVLRLIADRVGALMGVSLVGVSLWDEAMQALVTRTASGERERLQPSVKLGEGLVGRVAERREGLIVNDYPHWPHALPTVKAHTKLMAAMAEPLLYRERLVGVIFLSTEEPERRFDREDQALVRLFAAQAAIAIENARLFEAQRLAYADLQRAQEGLIRSEKLRALGQMAAGVAHDLNNMLAAILGQAELLRLRVKLPEVQEALEILSTVASDGAQVVRRLQEFGRQQASTTLLSCDLALIVQESLEFTRPRWQDEAQQQHRCIHVQTALDNLPRILGNASEIREALTNLILNAVDAMPTGGSLTVAGYSDPAPSSSEVAERVLLTVTDTGIGEDVRRHIFDPFFTTKGLRGTGLGLAVVYGVMERHGGRIDVTSTPGQGTTFTLRFRAVPHGEEVAAQAGRSTTPPSRRILLIDDEETVRTTLANLLRAVGHEVTEADSGAEGLARLAESLVDLVITDLGMPEMTGWDVAQKIKAVHSSLPVILLTGWGQYVTGTSPGQHCVDRVLAKPIQLEELQHVIADFIAHPLVRPRE